MTQPRICCLVFARLASTRVPNKLLQDVGGRTLLERGMEYLAKLRAACPNVTPIVCSPAGDKAIRMECQQREIEWLADPTTDAKSWPELIAPHVPMLQERFDWVWDANVFCHPFLRVETGQKIVAMIEEANGPFVVTRDRKGVVWKFFTPEPAVIGSGELANTKTNPNYHELAHIAYCWPSETLGWSERALAIAAIPWAIDLYWSELIDIDTPEDLEHARAVAKGAGL